MHPVVVLALLQVGVPLLLIVANAALPAWSRIAFVARSGALAGLLIYLHHAGVWLFPPWWTPFAMLVLHMGLVVMRLRRRVRKGRVGAVAEGIVAAAALAGVAVVMKPALDGQSAPDIAIDLRQPLGPGRYLVVSGGSTLPVNTHQRTLDDGYEAARGQSHAVDIIGIDRLGFYASGAAPEDPAAYAIFGTPILAPCSGEVAMAIDGLSDQPVPVMDRANLAGNHVFLACGDLHILLAHMEGGSVQVDTGDSVEAGEMLGRVGNSGNTSSPHLHMHVQRGMPVDAPLSGVPVHFTIGGRYLTRNQRFVVE